MRTLLRRNNKNEPCKSPSPDFACRNIIKNTTIEVEDIRSKMKKADEKELKYELESSISQIAGSDHPSIDHKYKQIYQEYNKLKYENKALSEQNKLLNQENQRLSLQDDKNKNISQLNSIITSKGETEALREKVIFLDEQKKKIERQYANEKNKNEQSYKNIESLRLELLLIKEEFKKQNKGEGAPSSVLSITDQESRFILLSNNILSNYEEKMKKVHEELNSRINRVEMMEKILKEQHTRIVTQSRFNKTPPSAKSSGNWANDTSAKFDSRYKEYKDFPTTTDKQQRQALPLSSSPIDRHFQFQDSTVERLQHQNINLGEQLRYREAEIERLKMDKQKLVAVLHDYEREKKGIKISTPKFNDGQENIFKKISGLEQTISKFKEESYYYQNENIRLKTELQMIQNNTSIEKKQYNNKIDYLQKIIKFYEDKRNSEPLISAQCQQCLKKEEEINRLIQKLKRVEERYDRNLTELKNKFQSDIDEYQKKLTHSESMGSQKFSSLEEKYQNAKAKNKQLTSQLNNYMMMLEYIREKIQSNEIKDLLNENLSFYTDVEKNLYSERESYNKTIIDFKNKLLQKDQALAGIETALSLKTMELELLKTELEKVKNINNELQTNSVNILQTNLVFMSREKKQSKYNKFLDNNETILDRVHSGTDKLDILYQKINNTLHFDMGSSNII